MSSWSKLGVPEEILKALSEEGFMEPTPIQKMVLPSAIQNNRDVIGAAQTGSGKTLAFGIPLLNSAMQVKKSIEEEEQKQREACIESDEGIGSEGGQVVDESEGMDIAPPEDMLGDEGSDDGYDLPPTEVERGELQAGATGLVCAQILERFDFQNSETESDVEEDNAEKKPPSNNRPLLGLVLAPTRELAIQVKEHIDKAAKYTGITSVVVVGGMAAQKQERLLKKCPEIVIATPGRLWELIQQGNQHLSKVEDIRMLVIDEADRMVEKGHFKELTNLLAMINANPEKKKLRQTFIFSATLTLVHKGPDRFMKKKKKKQTEEMKLESLIGVIGLKEKPLIVDLSAKQKTAAQLTETRISCSAREKDLYVYYLLKTYPGRTLIFTNSIDCLRRVTSILTILQCQPLPLHSEMHQKQRLKNLDNFKSRSNGLLLATNVAAHGLDIPNVQHVIHYQVPRTSENYVHRSGRTARADKDGLSVMMVCPEELRAYRKIVQTLQKDDLPAFPVNTDLFPTLKNRLALACSIDRIVHTDTKKKVSNNSIESLAKAGELMLDDQMMHEMGDSFEQKRDMQHLKHLRQEMKTLLKQPLHLTSMAGIYSGKYPTRSGKLVMPFLTDVENKSAISQVKKRPEPVTQPQEETETAPTGEKKKRKRKSRAWILQKKLKRARAENKAESD